MLQYTFFICYCGQWVGIQRANKRCIVLRSFQLFQGHRMQRNYRGEGYSPVQVIACSVHSQDRAGGLGKRPVHWLTTCGSTAYSQVQLRAVTTIRRPALLFLTDILYKQKCIYNHAKMPICSIDLFNCANIRSFLSPFKKWTWRPNFEDLQ